MNPFESFDFSGLSAAFKQAAIDAGNAVIADLSVLKLDTEQAALVAGATERLTSCQLRLRFASEAERPELETQSKESLAVLANVNAEKQKDIQDAVERHVNTVVSTFLTIMLKVVTV